jgi:iron complex outermembrane receptor protein
MSDLPCRRMSGVRLVVLVGALFFANDSFAQDLPITELKRLSLEELIDIEVTSVSRKRERATEVPAAVHVITEEDVRRSGARSIPEVLRLAPNLHVAQFSSRGGLSARGDLMRRLRTNSSF